MRNYVSRGGIKLQAALDQFKVDVSGKVVLDVGSSTGGFVDCLLQNGASKVYSVDTAYGELAWKLRNDPRVVVMERTNILHLTHLPARNTSGVGFDSPEVEGVDLITIDAGWTKLELVLPAVKKFLKLGGIIIALLKPHYEAEKGELRKGVVPLELVENVQHRVLDKIQSLGFKVEEVMESPILGGGGNKEYLLYLTVPSSE
ncbi:MAG: Hemolysin A [Candidatus Daviesbacteria bacterium GW2011_GWA1_41_61]|nr:MAG: Hemolysin A [Candidatus Daviesbacteria bacterium GW2011_GWC1_40_9]KKR93739.1 MAG: Hemolysin A [Candidatus Daviesbacteria bacterium GW2011_GWB1_41_15]KKS15205.1 MAG: Hemolysin A [Candidatus Daviesbacteria bacterium GW2011_GWA1_41_61]